jgi:hypothetical protein
LLVPKVCFKFVRQKAKGLVSDDFGYVISGLFTSNVRITNLLLGFDDSENIAVGLLSGLISSGSLKLGVVQATSVMRTLQIGDRPTKLAQAVAELGRIDKTIHALTYIDDEAERRRILFHGKQGELRQRYREGQEDQLSSLQLEICLGRSKRVL